MDTRTSRIHSRIHSRIRSRIRSSIIRPVVAAVALLLGLGLAGGASVVAAGASAMAAAPAGDLIVRVEGNAAEGFGIFFHDGTAIYPPTDSEARAECGEYDSMRARVRCRTEARTWYRDLGELKRSLRWALRQ